MGRIRTVINLSVLPHNLQVLQKTAPNISVLAVIRAAAAYRWGLS